MRCTKVTRTPRQPWVRLLPGCRRGKGVSSQPHCLGASVGGYGRHCDTDRFPVSSLGSTQGGLHGRTGGRSYRRAGGGEPGTGQKFQGKRGGRAEGSNPDASIRASGATMSYIHAGPNSGGFAGVGGAGGYSRGIQANGQHQSGSRTFAGPGGLHPGQFDPTGQQMAAFANRQHMVSHR